MDDFQVWVTPFHLFKIIIMNVPLTIITGSNVDDGIIFTGFPHLGGGLFTGTLLLVRLSM